MSVPPSDSPPRCTPGSVPPAAASALLHHHPSYPVQFAPFVAGGGFRPAAEVERELEQASAIDAALVLLHDQRAGLTGGTAAAATTVAAAAAGVAAPSATGATAAGGGGGAGERAGGAEAPPDGHARGGIGSLLGGALISGLHAVERVMDGVSLAVSHSLADPLAAALGSKAPERVLEPLRVVCRLRPARPPLGRRSARLSCAYGAVRVRGAVRGASPTSFQLDALLEEAASQEVAYAHGAGTLVPRLLAGRRCAALFVGQSGSGKTHAAFGSPAVLADFRSRGDDEWGAAPRASRQLFDTLGETIGAAGPLELSVTWYEVRGSQLTDLLRPEPHEATPGRDGRTDGRTGGGGGARGTHDVDEVVLRVRESIRAGPYVQGLRRVVVESHDQVLGLLSVGASRRTLSTARANLRSSAGTSFFTLHLRSRVGTPQEPPPPDEPSLTLIDVAAGPAPSPRGSGSKGAVKAERAQGASPSHHRGAGGVGRGASGGGDASGASRASNAAAAVSLGAGDRTSPLGATHAALSDCIEMLHGAQIRSESPRSLAAAFRQQPVTRLLQPVFLGACTTTAVVTCGVSDGELDATLAALRLGVLLRSTTTKVPPSVPPLLPLSRRVRPPAVAAIGPLGGTSPPRRLPTEYAAFADGLGETEAGAGDAAWGDEAGAYAAADATWGDEAERGWRPAPPLLATTPRDAREVSASTPWGGALLPPSSAAAMCADACVDTATIRALREHAGALQRHITATADQTGVRPKPSPVVSELGGLGGDARLYGTPAGDRQPSEWAVGFSADGGHSTPDWAAGFSADETWADLYALGGERQDAATPEQMWADRMY